MKGRVVVSVTLRVKRSPRVLVENASNLMQRAAVVAVIVIVVYGEAALLHVGELPHHRFAVDVARKRVGHFEFVMRGATTDHGARQPAQRVVAILDREGPNEVVFTACCVLDAGDVANLVVAG